MALLTRPLTVDEARTLAAYRRAAAKVHERFWPYRHHQFQARIFRSDLDDEADLIPDSDFIALLTAFRLVYATREKSHFGRVANIVYLVGDDDARKIVKMMRENWNEVPRRPWLYVSQDEHFDPGEMIDTWINGEVFHQDERQLVRVDRLRDLGAMAFMTLQLTVRDMCFPLLGLDNLCALLLEEPLRPVPHPDDSAIPGAG